VTETAYTLSFGGQNLASNANDLRNYAATNLGSRRHSILGTIDYVTDPFDHSAGSVPVTIGIFGMRISLATGPAGGRLVDARFAGNYMQFKQSSARSNAYVTRNIHRVRLYQYFDANATGVFDPDTESAMPMGTLLSPQFGSARRGAASDAVYTYTGRTALRRPIRLVANSSYFIDVTYETSIGRSIRADDATTYHLWSPNGMTFLYSAE
jgi:hypothetical protein